MFLLILYNWYNWFCTTLTPFQRFSLSFQIMAFVMGLPYYFCDWLDIVRKTYFSPFNSSYCMYYVSARKGVGVETFMGGEIRKKGWKKRRKWCLSLHYEALSNLYQTFTCFKMFCSIESFRFGRQLKIYNRIWNLFIRVIAIPAD